MNQRDWKEIEKLLYEEFDVDVGHSVYHKIKNIFKLYLDAAMEANMKLEAINRELVLIEAFHKNPSCLEPLTGDSVVKRIRNIIL